jgi:Helicase associated domain
MELKSCLISINRYCSEGMWNLHEANWGKMVVALKEYKEKHGDCNVPSGWVENKPLANWVSKQCTNYRHGILSDDRIKRLDDLALSGIFKKDKAETK